jgi:ribosomal protein S18 acetylase RimI-like enzyme
MTAFEQSAQYQLKMNVVVRPAIATDVQQLEWFGEYAHFRNLIQRAYDEQLAGNRLILVADLNGFPIGQLFIQYEAHNHRIADGYHRAYFYSFRIFHLFRGQGIGTYMLTYAQQLIYNMNYRYATIAVAKDNPDALRLYQRLGYRIIGEDSGNWTYVDHLGITQYVHEPSWVLEQKLSFAE